MRRMFTENQIKEIANEVATLLTENKQDKVTMGTFNTPSDFVSDDPTEEQIKLVNEEQVKITPSEADRMINIVKRIINKGFAKYSINLLYLTLSNYSKDEEHEEITITCGEYGNSSQTGIFISLYVCKAFNAQDDTYYSMDYKEL